MDPLPPSPASEDSTDVLAECLDAAARGETGRVERARRDHPHLVPRIDAALAAVGALVRETGPPEPGSSGEIRPGSRVGRFKVLETIGRGGNGAVFRVHDPKLHRDLALKALLPGILGSPEAFERFRREGQALARVQHPGIVSVHDVGETSAGIPWFVMDLVDGCSLAVILRNLADREPRSLAPEQLLPPGATASASRGRSWVEAVVRMGVELADALDHAHGCGVVHRDVKPGNVLIDRQGHARLIDFCVALDDPDEALTRTGVTPGTPLYMAPEQIRGERSAVGPATDVYGLGATLYQCLTLSAPFRGGSTADVYQRIQTQDPPRIRKINPAVPRDLEIVIGKSLEKDPRRRYATPRELREDLEALLALRPIQASPPGTWTRLHRTARRNPASAATTLALAFAAGLTILWALAEPILAGRAAWAEYKEKRAGEYGLDAKEGELLEAQAAQFNHIPVADRVQLAGLERALEDLRDEVDRSLRAAEVSYSGAEARLGFVPWLGDHLSKKLFEVYLHQRKLARDRRELEQAELYGDRAIELAKRHGRSDDWLTSQASLVLSQAPGAVAFLFRYDDYERIPGRDDQIPRLVPVPVDIERPGREDSPPVGFQYGDLSLVVTDVLAPPGPASDRLQAGDVIFEIGGRSVRSGGVYVSEVHEGGLADQQGIRPLDRIVSCNGLAIECLFDWDSIDARLYPDADVKAASRFDFRIARDEQESRMLQVDVPAYLRALVQAAPFELRHLSPRGWMAPMIAEHPDEPCCLEDLAGFEASDLAGSLVHLDRPLEVRGIFAECTCPDGIHLLHPNEATSLELEISAYPLLRYRWNEWRPDQRQTLRLPEGSYLAQIEVPGHAWFRLPFVVELGADKLLRIDDRIPRKEEIPPGFVWIPKGSRDGLFHAPAEPGQSFPLSSTMGTVEESYFISRFEVTFGEWAEFLNSGPALPSSNREKPSIGSRRAEGTSATTPLEGSSMQEASSSSERNPMTVDELFAESFIPRRSSGNRWGIHQVLDRAGQPAISRWMPGGCTTADSPLVGIKRGLPIQEYLAWINRKAAEAGHSWRFELPDRFEWEKGGRGADGRRFPWGDRFDFSLCNSIFAHQDPIQQQELVLEPIGRFPTDESPYGLREMAGGAVERNSDWFPPPLSAWYPERGGSWLEHRPSAFHLSSIFSPEKDTPTQGFRLVARSRN